MSTTARIVGSILAADFSCLGDQVREADRAGVDRFQVDVMDGRFVPNLAMGPEIVRALRRVSGTPIEVHLMVEEPIRFVEMFARAGADHILVQVESTSSLYRTLLAISESGAQAGLVLNPGTPVEAVREVWSLTSMITVMTVEPGFGGQRFINAMLDKIRRVRDLVRDTDIEVDGGVDAEHAPLAASAGAGLLVAGTSLFGHPDGISAGVAELRSALG